MMEAMYKASGTTGLLAILAYAVAEKSKNNNVQRTERVTSVKRNEKCPLQTSTASTLMLMMHQTKARP